MKKIKLINFLLPLLGVGSLTIIPIVTTACGQEQINNQNQTVANDSSKATDSTSTSVVNEWAANKKIENEKILKNIRWFYKSSNTQSDKDSINADLTPKNLDAAIGQVYDLNGDDKIITDMQNGSNNLNFYPYVKCGKNQYTPINVVTTSPTGTEIKNSWFVANDNPALKGKILTMDYFIPTVALANVPSTQQSSSDNLDTSYQDSYKLTIHKLTLSDSTSEFPNGDPRTMATVEQTSGKAEIDNSLVLLDMKRPNPTSVENLMQKYQNIATVPSTGSDMSYLQQINHFITTIDGLDDKAGVQPFNEVDLKNLFKEFSEINNMSNAVDVISSLSVKDAKVFQIIQGIIYQLFNVVDNEDHKLFSIVSAIVDGLTEIKEHYRGNPNISNNTNPVGITDNQVVQIVDEVGKVLYSTVLFYVGFAKELYQLALNCVQVVNMPNPVSISKK
ncbi:hypothetical protein [Mycoplasmoides alvi]|uniref:hypothetical protein n=1 Tax=Mycoplasmoides alvi TaxID=78580 RepID=UPI00051BE39B|nr:hypothetical protein [Mycoplasmoides alvi]